MNATPSAQYKPVDFPPAIIDVKRAISSGDGKTVRSIITISLKGSYFTVKSVSVMSFHFSLMFVEKVPF